MQEMEIKSAEISSTHDKYTLTNHQIFYFVIWHHLRHILSITVMYFECVSYVENSIQIEKSYITLIMASST